MNDVYKILTKEEWSDASKLGYVKTDIDESDGFIHFSTSKGRRLKINRVFPGRILSEQRMAKRVKEKFCTKKETL